MKKKVEVDVKGLLAKLQTRKKLTESQVQALCFSASSLFMDQPMLLRVRVPVKICGDVHGQFQDLLKIFELVGKPPDTRFLFLGDYVDRGKNSVQTFLYLVLLKLKFPKSVYMLRGNHECSRLNKIYGFYQECVQKYSGKIWKSFTDVFNRLPVTAVIEQNILCMHGGISPSLLKLQSIEKLSRPTQVPEEGLLCDILWSDPNENHDGWQQNERGISFTFGATALKTFLKKNQLELIVRGHQVVQDGYQFFSQKKLVTVFSAPNYCGQFDNKGAVMSINEEMVISFQILKPLNRPSGKKSKAPKNY